jgi:hypothetical protein
MGIQFREFCRWIVGCQGLNVGSSEKLGKFQIGILNLVCKENTNFAVFRAKGCICTISQMLSCMLHLKWEIAPPS